jgi:hypothetical protein
VSTAKEIQTIKEQNSKLTEVKEETEEAFILLKTRYDELKALNHKHVEVNYWLYVPFGHICMHAAFTLRRSRLSSFDAFAYCPFVLSRRREGKGRRGFKPKTIRRDDARFGLATIVRMRKTKHLLTSNFLFLN